MLVSNFFDARLVQFAG